MYRVTFTNRCSYGSYNSDWKRVASDLTGVNGFIDPVELAEYLDDPRNTGSFRGGICSFRVKGKAVYLDQVYYTDKKPTDEDIKNIWNYTAGQNSDGWGEGFEQRPFPGCKSGQLYVNPYWGKESQKVAVDEVEKEAALTKTLVVPMDMYSSILSALEDSYRRIDTDRFNHTELGYHSTHMQVYKKEPTVEERARYKESADRMQKWFSEKAESYKVAIRMLIDTYGVA